MQTFRCSSSREESGRWRNMYAGVYNDRLVRELLEIPSIHQLLLFYQEHSRSCHRH